MTIRQQSLYGTAMSTNTRLQDHWPQMRAFIQENWPKMTNVELDRINGDYDVFIKYLKEYYGGFPLREAQALSKIQSYLNRLDNQITES